MPIEVELKARANDELIEQITDNFSFMKTVEQTDTYFDHPCREFEETGEAFRIREQNEEGRPSKKYLLTYKGPLISSESKSRTEVQTEIKREQKESIYSMMDLLGFKEAEKVVKKRSIYRGMEITATLDNVKGIGDYVEMEKICDPEEYKKTEGFLKDLLQSFGAEDFFRKSYLELIAEKREKDSE